MKKFLLLLLASCATPRPPDAARAILTLDADEQGPCVEQRWVEKDGTVVWAPEGVERAPVVIFLHGEKGAPQDHDSAQRLLARRGYAVLAPALGEADTDAAILGAAILARVRSEPMADETRLAALGVGAGAALAAALGETGYRAVVVWAPPALAASGVPGVAIVVEEFSAEGYSVQRIPGTREGFLDPPPGEGLPAARHDQLRAARQASADFLDRVFGAPGAACKR